MTTASRLTALTAATLVGFGLLTHTSSAEADEPDGTAFGQACGAVTVLAIPGSNETRDGVGRDAAVATLADATAYVTEHADASVRTHYLGYPAQLVPYGDSRAHGYEAAWSTVNYYAQQCPYTSFILLGYSQGAHIAGDLAATIGIQASPVSADRIRSVHLLADPARDPDVPVVGSGGASGGMFGQRGDFGALNGRVTEYCNDQDAVCNSSFSSVGNSLASFFGAHTSYESALLPNGQQTYTQAMSDALVQDIVNLNGATY
jgi:hypothetical protein